MQKNETVKNMCSTSILLFDFVLLLLGTTSRKLSYHIYKMGLIISSISFH